jgi:zinc transporter, ZIP family
MERLLPHLEPHFGAEEFSPGLEDAVLLTVAVAIHNIPEGLAMGLGYAAGGETMGPQLAIAVAFQNIPEGLAISLPLRRNGVNRWLTVAFATFSGMSEVVGAIAGVLGGSHLSALLPLGLAFAAGALIYVTADQLIPEAHDSTALPSWGVISGFALVLLVGWYAQAVL